MQINVNGSPEQMLIVAPGYIKYNGFSNSNNYSYTPGWMILGGGVYNGAFVGGKLDIHGGSIRQSAGVPNADMAFGMCIANSEL